MIIDAVAVIILCGMMLVPLFNTVVGLIVGAWLGGPAGRPHGPNRDNFALHRQ